MDKILSVRMVVLDVIETMRLMDPLRGPTETGNARGPFRDSEQLLCDPMSLADPPVGSG